MRIVVRSRRSRRAGLVALMVAVAGVLNGCVQTIPGTPVLLGGVDPTKVAGLPATDGPSGFRDGVAHAPLPLENTDDSDIDKLATDTVADVSDYWTKHFSTDFDGRQFEPVKRLVSYDSAGKGVEVCQHSTAGLVNAFYCPLEDSIAWDRGELLPGLYQSYGPVAVVTVLAHEMGHAVQRKLGAASNFSQATPTIVGEQQADCYAGAFLRSVAEGKARHLRLSTGDGLSKAMATVFAVRDAPGGSAAAKNAHGNAFDRVTAFQFGFSSGPKRCAQMDVNEIKGRITEMPFMKRDKDTGGNLPINEITIKVAENTLKEAFKDTGAALPTLTTSSAPCAGATLTKPAAYCPSTNTVVLDMSGLVAIGTPPKRGQQSNGIGDFAAFAEVASRYVLAVQKAVGLPLDDRAAGLRTACLVGAWTGAIGDRPSENNKSTTLRLTAGDLDKAVSELLSNDSLIASDLNGKQVQSGFARVEAFRMGFLNGNGPCTESFR